MTRVSVLLLAIVFGSAPASGGQPPASAQGAAPVSTLHEALASMRVSLAPPPDAPGTGRFDDLQGPADPHSAKRLCEGCPPRSFGRSILQTTIINGFYELANLARGQVTAHITPKTWWANMENGWVWDLDDFVVNQLGHPYQGSNYFNSGRANGLSFYESAALTAFGSATWEYFGETNMPSLNDFINTTLGGIALGEMFHRTAWLVRNPQATGKARLWSEIGGMVLDPVTGTNRFLRGDASRVMPRPSDMVPSALAGATAVGVLWRGSETRAVAATGQPFVELDGLYGMPGSGRSRTPYDAFAVRLRFGGGSGFSEARVRGRLLGEPFGGGRAQFSVIQSYDYQGNDAYQYGAQSFDGTFGYSHALSSRISLAIAGWGGATILGAVDSIPLDAPEEIPQEPEDSAGQGISEGPRYYDFGPGANFGVGVNLSRDGRTFALYSYEGRHLYSLDGVRANHFLQRSRLDVLVPVRGRLGVGASGEYFDRRTYYKDEAQTKKTYHYPQLRAYLTWNLSPLPAAAVQRQEPPVVSDGDPSVASRLWLVAGAASATLRGDCQNCEGDSPYRHGASVLATVGYRVNRRMDVGGEVFWVPQDTAFGRIRATHLDAVAQFRPWSSQGFFLKGGAGMAFVRDWVDVAGPEPVTSKALSVVIGAGWAFRQDERVGLQLFASQHAAAMGDLRTGESSVQDVMGNFWSLGAAIVIR